MDVSTCVKPAYDEAEMEKILLKPYDYTFQVLAYDLLPTKLSECLNNWLHVPREKLEKIKKIMRRINHSMAMFDDVLDDSLFRRNQPVTHNVFGLAMTLNTSWLTQFLALEETLELDHPKAAEVYCNCFLKALRGIGTNVHWRNTQYRVTQEEYNQMILKQTGGYVLLMVNLMKLFSDSKVNLDNFLKTFSIYYQIRDEYVNLKKPEAVEEGERIAEWKDLPKVSFCEDFSEGKISTPVLQALNSRHRDVILGILKMRPRDFKTKKYLLSLLEEGGGIQKTRELLHQLETEMFNEFSRFSGTYTMDVSTCVKPAYDEAEMEKILLKPYDYIFQVLAYDLVPTKLSECLNNWLHVPREKLEKIKKIMRRINSSIAMFDDVLDDPLFRRNQPATHYVFGLAMTLNTSWLTQFLAFEEILELGHPKAAKVYCNDFLTCLRGIGTQIHWRNTQYCVTQEEYNQMALKQTGNYILVMVNLMKLFSDSKVDLNNFLKSFSIYYQIRDEYVNLKKPEAVEEGERIAEWKDLPKVSFCEDFSEGRISTPVLQALNSRHRDVILGILKMRPRDFKTKKYLLSLLEEGGGIQKTREILNQLETEMFNEIERLGGNPMLVEFIRDLQTWDERV